MRSIADFFILSSLIGYLSISSGETTIMVSLSADIFYELWKFGWESRVWCVYYGPLLPFHFHHLYKLSASQTSQLEKLSPLWSTITIPNRQSQRREPRQEENRWLRGARSRTKIVLVLESFLMDSIKTWVKNNFQSWRSSLENCQK